MENELNRGANFATAVDPPIPSTFHLLSNLRRATDQRCLGENRTLMQKAPSWPFMLVALFLATFIAWTEGPMNPFWIWNALPVVLGYVLLCRAQRKDLRVIPELVFIIAAWGLVLLTHTAWMFDWRGPATGSSTSALVFIFLPVYAIILGSSVRLALA